MSPAVHFLCDSVKACQAHLQSDVGVMLRFEAARQLGLVAAHSAHLLLQTRPCRTLLRQQALAFVQRRLHPYSDAAGYSVAACTDQVHLEQGNLHSKPGIALPYHELMLQVLDTKDEHQQRVECQAKKLFLCWLTACAIVLRGTATLHTRATVFTLRSLCAWLLCWRGVAMERGVALLRGVVSMELWLLRPRRPVDASRSCSVARALLRSPEAPAPCSVRPACTAGL